MVFVPLVLVFFYFLENLLKLLSKKMVAKDKLGNLDFYNPKILVFSISLIYKKQLISVEVLFNILEPIFFNLAIFFEKLIF